MLNEKNIMACFQYNATSGEWVYETIQGNKLLDPADPSIKLQNGSDKVAVDMGHSIDGELSNWNLSINGNPLVIIPVANRGDLVNLNIAENEVVIVTNDPNFRTVVWLNALNVDGTKTLSYKFQSLNSGVGSYVFNEMSKKLNKLDTDKIEADIIDLDTRVIALDGRMNVVEADLLSLEIDVNNEIQTRADEDNLLSGRITALENKTAAVTRDINTGTTAISDKLTVGGAATLEDTSVKDLTVRGVVDGELKDVNNFKYIKVKKGTALNSGVFTNMTLEYNGTTAIIKGKYTQPIPQIVASLNLYNVIEPTPQFIIKNIKADFKSIKKENLFCVNTSIETDTIVSINFRNITATDQNIVLMPFDFQIEAEININDNTITWF